MAHLLAFSALLAFTSATSTTSAASATAPPTDKYYDCQFRSLAMSYAEENVLNEWPSATRRAVASAAIRSGLRLVQDCPAEPRHPTPVSATVPIATAADAAGTAARTAAGTATHFPYPPATFFVATDGDDAAAGTRTAPFLTIAGAQAQIRSVYPIVPARPAITVYLRAGHYYVAARKDDADARSGVKSGARGSPMAAFSEADSGRSAVEPITYAAEVGPDGSPIGVVTLHGGMLLSGISSGSTTPPSPPSPTPSRTPGVLTWSDATQGPRQTNLPPGTIRATLPVGIDIDAQVCLHLDKLLCVWGGMCVGGMCGRHLGELGERSSGEVCGGGEDVVISHCNVSVLGPRSSE